MIFLSSGTQKIGSGRSYLYIGRWSRGRLTHQKAGIRHFYYWGCPGIYSGMWLEKKAFLGGLTPLGTLLGAAGVTWEPFESLLGASVASRLARQIRQTGAQGKARRDKTKRQTDRQTDRTTIIRHGRSHKRETTNDRPL